MHVTVLVSHCDDSLFPSILVSGLDLFFKRFLFGSLLHSKHLHTLNRFFLCGRPSVPSILDVGPSAAHQYVDLVLVPAQLLRDHSSLPFPPLDKFVQVYIALPDMSSNSSTPSLSASSSTVKRACDSCHRRKVKCIGEGTKPCKNCISAGLTCTYNAIPQKKGPKGSRAKVLSELRENQRQSQLTSPLPANDYRFDGRSISPAWTKTPGLLSPEFVSVCVDAFFNNYLAFPILHRQRTQQIIANMEHSIEAYCMVVSLCAYLMIQPNIMLPQGMPLAGEFVQLSHASYGHLLLEETIRLRKSYNYVDVPTTTSVVTSYFLFGSYFFLDKQNMAWFYLREATTHAIELDMHEEESYKLSDPIESSRRRRVFWLLFITERWVRCSNSTLTDG
jgi:hypothetical protein